MFCEECGTRIVEGNAYCICCGARVRAQVPSVRQWNGPRHLRKGPRHLRKGPRHLRKDPRKKKWVLFCLMMLVIGAAAEYLIWSNTGERLGSKQFIRGDRYLMEQSYGEAAEAFTHSIDNGYTDVKVYLGLAEAHVQAHDTDSAISVLAEGMAALPPDERRLLAGRLFRIYKDLLKNEDAKSISGQLADIINRYDADTCRLLAEAYCAFGDTDKAIAILNEYRGTLDPGKVDAIIEVMRSKTGNTRGNVANGGCAVQQGDWIYYISNGDFALYKIGTDDDGWANISYDENINLNVIGDTIYFRDWTEDGALYKMRTDGTERQIITDDSCFYVTVSDGWIYYYNETHNGNLYKVRTDSSGRTRLNNDSTHFINVIGEWIYYTELDDIYKIRTDGMERTKVLECGGECGYLIVDGDWMYYYDGVDYGHLCKARTDGTEQTMLSKDLCEYFNVADGWIYYSNYSDGQKMYKMRTDGTGRVKLLDDPCLSICIVEDWIYYEDEDYYYRMRFDGSEQQKVK